MADPFTTTIVGSILGGVASGILSPGAPPAPPGAKAMPLPDGEEARKARARQIASIQSRSGRASTILSDDDKLG